MGVYVFLGSKPLMGIPGCRSQTLQVKPSSLEFYRAQPQSLGLRVLSVISSFERLLEDFLQGFPPDGSSLGCTEDSYC